MNRKFKYPKRNNEISLVLSNFKTFLLLPSMTEPGTQMIKKLASDMETKNLILSFQKLTFV